MPGDTSVTYYQLHVAALTSSLWAWPSASFLPSKEQPVWCAELVRCLGIMPSFWKHSLTKSGIPMKVLIPAYMISRRHYRYSNTRSYDKELNACQWMWQTKLTMFCSILTIAQCNEIMSLWHVDIVMKERSNWPLVTHTQLLFIEGAEQRLLSSNTPNSLAWHNLKYLSVRTQNVSVSYHGKKWKIFWWSDCMLCISQSKDLPQIKIIIYILSSLVTET